MFDEQFDQYGRMRIPDGMRYYKKTDAQNNVPRYVIRLNETVDHICLQHAAEVAMVRHCASRLTVVRDDMRF